MMKPIMSMEAINRQILKTLEKSLVFMAEAHRQWDGVYPRPTPTRLQQFKRLIRFYAVKNYMSNLWDAICGRERDYE